MNVQFWTQVNHSPPKYVAQKRFTTERRQPWRLEIFTNFSREDRESQSLFAVLKYPQIDRVIRCNSFKSLASLQLVEIYEISQLFPGVLKWNYARILFLQASLIASGKDS